MSHLRRLAWSGATCLVMSVALVAAAQKPDRDTKDKDVKDAEGRRPRLSLKAQPIISMSPSRVVLTAELVGGANDFEEFYCPTVEWDWGDGTQSESTSDCEPYVPGKSEIKRRFTVSHVFRAGMFKVSLRLKRHDRAITSATVSIQVRPGIRDNGDDSGRPGTSRNRTLVVPQANIATIALTP
jgi:hypothetical protein